MKKLYYEWCSHCEAESRIEWNIEKDGFRTICQNCGKKLMLCNECLHRGYSCDYSNETDSCRHSKFKQEKFKAKIIIALNSEFPNIEITKELLDFLAECGVKWGCLDSNIFGWLREALNDYADSQGG